MSSRRILGMLLIVIALTAWWSTTYADGEDDCKSACEMQRKQCVEACGEHPNPVECDADCRDDLEDCDRHCR